MKLADTIDQDMRIAEYALGLSPTQELEQIQDMLSRSDPAAACALKWEAYLLGICDSMTPIAPPEDLFARIQDALGHEPHRAPPAPATTPARTAIPASASAQAPTPLPSPSRAPAPAPASAPATAPASTPLPEQAPGRLQSPSRIPATSSHASGASPATALGRATAQPAAQRRRRDHSLVLWRVLTVALGVLVVVLAIFLAKAWSRPDIPAIQIVQVAPTHAAILHAPGQSSTPGWLVTVDTQGTVRLDPQVKTTLRPDEAVQLWTRGVNGLDNRSLGLIDPNQPVTIPVGLIGPVSTGQIFEMTLEPKSGSSTGKPEGPILFIGQMVRFGVQSSSKPLA